MDPIIDSEWLGWKNEPSDEMQIVGNGARSWQWRELGINPPNYPPNKTVLENIAEDILVQKPLKIRSCDLPGYPRSTFLMVFSPDGTKVASTHGNHNVYVSELASGKHVRILRGHPRTPWCISFHPSHPLLIGSGCLGGQVRVWDIASGGSEVWNVRNDTVIASLAFHPREQLLVIATFNELYFWDWSQPAPFTKVSTNNVNEKVRYVAFDALGYKLITGISLWACPGGPANNSLLQQNPSPSPTSNPTNNTRRDDSDDGPGVSRPPDSPNTAQDMIVNSYQNLVQRYDSLVRNYQRLFMVRHRLTNAPPPPSTIDRGTDPMESDVSPGTSGWSRSSRSTASTPLDDVNPTPGTSRQLDANDSGDGDNSSSRLLNLDVLSFDSNPSRRNESSPNQERSLNFGSRSSAFQPLNGFERSFRTVDQNERIRLLPNPFSTPNASPRPARVSFSDSIPEHNMTNTSRTSIFACSRLGTSPGTTFRRRNLSPLQTQDTSGNENQHTPNVNVLSPSTSNRNLLQTSTESENLPSTSNTSPQRRTMTNSSTQMSPVNAPVDAQTINESLDLIRDILRDSGTRLLNLITNRSLSTLMSLQRNIPRRGSGPQAQSDDNEGGRRTSGGDPRVRPFSPSWRDLLFSSSDSDSDQSPEVNILRTRNSTFQENNSRDNDGPSASTSSERIAHPTDRMVFELNDGSRASNEAPIRDSSGINVSLSNSRFHVRTHSDPIDSGTASNTATDAGTTAGEPTENQHREIPEFDPDRPSTSRDDFWRRGPVVPPDDAYRRVKSGISALQKHTMQLTNLWLRGNRTTMRDLRTMWENLRRRIITLCRETGNQGAPSHYTRPLQDRIMMLREIRDNLIRPSRNERFGLWNHDPERHCSNYNRPPTSDNTTNINATESQLDTTPENVSDNRSTPARSCSQARTATTMTSSPSFRRRPQVNYRWLLDDEHRRRFRNPVANRLTPRYTSSNRSRGNLARAIEISATRREIRMRAMQVLSLMFNMMMNCLEERGLSQLIINMLRTLKRALALTCLIVMSNRHNGRTGTDTASTSQSVDSLDVVRIQNVDHTGPVNIDGPDELPPSNNPQPPAEPKANNSDDKSINESPKDNAQTEKPSTSKIIPETNINVQNEDIPSSSLHPTSQKWSNRLAVQIAAANRNNSATARNRRELYIESKREKALHRTNPAAHPIMKRTPLPPVANYRIPSVRSASSRNSLPRCRTPRIVSQNYEPVAGPSNAPTLNENHNHQESSGSEMNEFDHRVNFIRVAHMQAVRLRNAARNRFRRLQTIRLYPPSTVREMFTIHLSRERQPENESSSGQSIPEVGNHPPLAMFRPHILTSRGESSRPNENGHVHTVLTSPNVPSVPMNDLPPNAEGQGAQQQRLPRIHEYLQPIILAQLNVQNAMMMEEEGGGGENDPNVAGGPGGGARRMSGMAGLLDAGIISEALPAPSHRVQAWDFTTGDTPQISDSTKNVVVQRCRIHNDASIDISKDGRLLVALLPVPRLRNTNHWLGVYSLEWGRLGQCLHTAVLEQSAVSVALSPTARHLAVGLGSRRFTSAPHNGNNVFALLYRLDPLDSSSRTGLSPIKELEKNWEHGFISLNCLRWAPQPGQGLVYANNTGQLIILS